MSEFNFETEASHWVSGPKISTIMNFGPWWYVETKPSRDDLVMAELAEKLLRIGYVGRETWYYNGDMITRYKVTKAGRAAFKKYRRSVDKKFEKILKEI